MNTTASPGSRPSPPARLLGGAAVVLAVALAASWIVTDMETYMRLAFGRMTAARGPWPGEDPFLYSLPGLPWRNPQWLGDLLLYGVYLATGDPGLVALKLAAHATGWLLVYRLALARGGTPLTTVALTVMMLAASEWRLTERNDMHLYWLAPLYALVLERARAAPRALWALAPLGILWANVHASFVVGWILVAASLGGALIGGAGEERDPRRARILALVLAVHPLLPLVSPDGIHAYRQVIDHTWHGRALAAVISEWEPAARQPATLAVLPLHLLGIGGLATFLPRPNRRVAGFVLFSAGLVLAHGTFRFVLLFGMLAIPAVAPNLARIREARGIGRRAGTLAGAALLALAALLLAPAVALARAREPALERWDFPSRTGRWIARHAPPGSRLYAPFDGSQALIWEAPAVPLYVAPHLNFPLTFLVRFFAQVHPKPRRFDQEVARFGINLALVDLMGRSRPLLAHLSGASDWQLVYLDGFFALFARRTAANQGLLAQHAYRCLRPGFALPYLAACPADTRRAEIGRLALEGPALARAARGFELLVAAGSATPVLARAKIESARDLLASAIPALPDAPPLPAYLAEAHLRLGERDHARRVLDEALARMPDSPRLRAAARSLDRPTADRDAGGAAPGP